MKKFIDVLLAKVSGITRLVAVFICVSELENDLNHIASTLYAELTIVKSLFAFSTLMPLPPTRGIFRPC